MRPLQPDLTNGLMMFERVGGRVGGAEDFDVEALEEFARRKFGGGQFFSKQNHNNRSALEADGFSSTPKTSLSSCVSQMPLGVPRKR